MNVLRFLEKRYAQRIDQLAKASSLLDPKIETQARAIVEGVRQKGDAALADFTKRFDGVMLRPARFPVTHAELLAASLNADAALRRAVDLAHKNISLFSRKSLRKNWSHTNAQGATAGEKFDPFGRVGIYIPGGTAPLVSTALMTITLAKVAGCPEIVVCTPAGRDGGVNAALLYAVRKAGATEIYRVGGAQAIAAMALGTKTIRPVQKIYGPGNAYVVAAKRLLFGQVAIDLLPGPSELLVLADETAPPSFIAADMLAQAEHGSGHERVWLVTPSLKLIRSVEKQIQTQLPSLSRRTWIRKALKNNGWLIQCKSLDEGVDLVNRFAPEHCEVMTRGAAKLSGKIHKAGALFLGPWSPTVLGDYVAGPSHTLPTGGAGASFAGLTVDQFQRRTSVVAYNQTALRRSVDAVHTFATMEGLDAHGRSAEIRLQKKRKPRR